LGFRGFPPTTISGTLKAATSAEALLLDALDALRLPAILLQSVPALTPALLAKWPIGPN
jgi:hypothetical protein